MILNGSSAIADSALAGLEVQGVRVEFLLFGLTLLGIAALHRQALWVAVGGLVALIAFRLVFTEFDAAAHFFGGSSAPGGVDHEGEWRLLLNLLGLLLGFSLLAKQF